MGLKGLRLAFLAKNSYLQRIFLSRIWGHHPPTPPVNGKSLCPKKISGMGGTPSPLSGKNPLNSFSKAPLICALIFFIFPKDPRPGSSYAVL